MLLPFSEDAFKFPSIIKLDEKFNAEGFRESSFAFFNASR